MNENRKPSDDQIDLVAMISLIWNKKVYILKIATAFCVVGLLLSFLTTKQYKASCTLLPESNSKENSKLAGFGSLAGLAGLDLGTTTSTELSTRLYPVIAESLPLVLEVLNDTIYFENENIYSTSFNYLKDYESSSLSEIIVGIPIFIKNLFTSASNPISNFTSVNFYRFTKEEWKLISDFANRIELINDDDTGLITVTVTMPDAVAAAQLTNSVKDKVTAAVTFYNTSKAKENLEFIRKSFLEAKTDFESIQLELAKLIDRNLNISSAQAKIELKVIQNKYDVAFEVYKSLASQVEQAKIKLKEDTPVFTTLEPTVVPLKSMNVSTFFVAIFSFILGVFFGIFLIGFRRVANALTLE